MSLRGKKKRAFNIFVMALFFITLQVLTFGVVLPYLFSAESTEAVVTGSCVLIGDLIFIVYLVMDNFFNEEEVSE